MIHHIVGSTWIQGMAITLQGIALASVAAHRLGAGGTQRPLRELMKRMLFAAAHPRAALPWLRYLEHPTLLPLVRKHPQLLDKPRRLYLNSRWTPDQRAKALVAHYERMADHLRSDVAESLYTGSALKLSNISLRDNACAASIWIDHARSQMHEGELTLQLRASTSDASDRSDLPAVRPKALLVWAAQTCATQWKLDVRGIAPAAHPLTDAHRHGPRNAAAA